MKIAVLAALLALSSSAFALDNSNAVTSGTQSTAQQQSNVNVNTAIGGGGPDQHVTYDGSYTMKSAPTVYAPALTASLTETCWGSVSGGVSVVGVGVTAGATVKDADCNRRLTASVAWKMDRKDIAFNLMCQDDNFRAAAELTDKPCGQPVRLTTQNNTVPMIANEPRDPLVRARMDLPPLPAGK